MPSEVTEAITENSKFSIHSVPVSVKPAPATRKCMNEVIMTIKYIPDIHLLFAFISIYYSVFKLFVFGCLYDHTTRNLTNICAIKMIADIMKL